MPLSFVFVLICSLFFWYFFLVFFVFWYGKEFLAVVLVPNSSHNDK